MSSSIWRQGHKQFRAPFFKGALTGSSGVSFFYSIKPRPPPPAVDFDFTVNEPVFNQSMEEIASIENWVQTIDGSGRWVWATVNGCMSGEQPIGDYEFQIIVYSKGVRNASLRFAVDDRIKAVSVNGVQISNQVMGTWSEVTNLDLGMFARGKNLVSITALNYASRSGLIFTIVDSQTGEVLASSDEDSMRSGDFTPQEYGD